MERQINSSLDFENEVPFVHIFPLQHGFVVEIGFPQDIDKKFVKCISNITLYQTRRVLEEWIVRLINADTRVYPSLERIEAALKRGGYSEFVLVDKIGTRIGLCQGMTNGG